MSDLDARVAALLAHADAMTDLYKSTSPIKPLGLAFRRANLENAIRAELQKPALHEPCTWDEAKHVIAAMGYFTSFDNDVITMQRAIDAVLQGRAKPTTVMYNPTAIDAFSLEQKTNNIPIRVKETKPAQEEITDEQIDEVARDWHYTLRKETLGNGEDIMRWTFSAERLRSFVRAAIRSRKGEKT